MWLAFFLLALAVHTTSAGSLAGGEQRSQTDPYGIVEYTYYVVTACAYVVTAQLHAHAIVRMSVLHQQLCSTSISTLAEIARISF